MKNEELRMNDMFEELQLDVPIFNFSFLTFNSINVNDLQTPTISCRA